MTDTVELVVYGEAQPAGSKIAGVAGNGRRFVRDDNPGSRRWKDLVSQAAGRVMDGRPLLAGPLELELVFHRTRPKGHFGRRGLLPSAPARPVVKPDVLKLARAVEDALTGVVWRDDAQVVEERLSKVYGEPARVEIRVSPLIEADRAPDERRREEKVECLF